MYEYEIFIIGTYDVCNTLHQINQTYQFICYNSKAIDKNH